MCVHVRGTGKNMLHTYEMYDQKANIFKIHKMTIMQKLANWAYLKLAKAARITANQMA